MLIRRDALHALGLAALAAGNPVLPAAAAETPSPPDRSAEVGHAQVGLLVYPGMILLDLVGPLTILGMTGAACHRVGASLDAVTTDVGITVQPTATYATCPRDLDVLFVPGGLKGTVALMRSPAALAFLADRGNRARYVTSVCTGSLALAAAGLLEGYKATSHWNVVELLPLMGAQPVAARVVEDRNRITGGGVTAGLDFGLVLASRLRGEETAKRIQLVLEYDPQPPFAAGSPGKAGHELTAAVRQRLEPATAAARDAAIKAAARLSL